MSVCCVCLCVPSQKPRFPVDWSLLVEESIANICIPLDIFGFLTYQWFFSSFFSWVFGSLQTSLLCIMEELAGCWYMAVAVCASDSWQLTADRWQVICHTWQLTFLFSSSFSVRFGIGDTIRSADSAHIKYSMSPLHGIFKLQYTDTVVTDPCSMLQHALFHLWGSSVEWWCLVQFGAVHQLGCNQLQQLS